VQPIAVTPADRPCDTSARCLPITLLAFALSGMSLMGLPPSGGFAAKWLLLRAALETGQWWWMLVILFEGVLTGAYPYRVLASAGFSNDAAPVIEQSVSPWREWLVLTLALVSIAMGLMPLASFDVLLIGRIGLTAAGGPLP
jgi:formate hydrogenlyase subunit 3/multisubunit Na+/H+ antiporter MnhD subunit